jgi:cystathionine gamma-synthase
MKRETKLVGVTGHDLSPPLHRASTFDRARGDYVYQRHGNPTNEEAERALGELDGGDALLFPSGSAAITSVLLALLEPGKRLALANDAYWGTPVLAQLELARWGLVVEEFDQTGPAPENADAVWLEAPSNPLLRVPDVAAHVAAARERGALVVVDSTAATPLHLRPLELGADVAVHSATKYLSGHSDVLLGAAVFRERALRDRVAEFRTRTGIVAAPDAAWLLLRGLRTLAVRFERQSQTALELARRLEAHPAVERVHHPGFGGLLSFVTTGDAELVERGTTLIRNATSLGGVESVLETRYRWEADRVPKNLVRLSVGLEDVDDLWQDLDQALKNPVSKS